ncbi:MAG: EAL domain-containing protein [Treponemataceae bacterium]|nr:EAL domain-containing protein [Treponemataceae bacterium]
MADTADFELDENMQGKPLVLVVDDEEVNRMLLTNILEERYKVETASDGFEALQLIRQYRSILSAVLLDLSMPNMDGFEVLREMRMDEMLRHIPTLVLTAQNDAEIESFERGASDFITKPFDMPDMILARVAKSIRMAEENYIIRTTEKDPLTELPNMAYFRTLCEAEKARLSAKGESAAFIYIDIVNMKSYNSRFGYPEGDRLLMETATVLQNTFANMPVSRISEDHFAVMTSAAQHKQLLEDFQRRLRQIGKGNPTEIHAGIFQDNGEIAADIITAMDYARLACLTLRGNYTDSVCYYDRKLMKEYDDRQHVLANFNQALEERWIKAYYQPIVRAQTDEVCNFEALARWIDPQRGFLSPAAFVPVIEDYNLGVRMDLYMVEEVCREYEVRRQGGLTPVPVSLNFCRTDFDQRDMVAAVAEIADKYHVPHDMLIIEVTESGFSRNASDLQEQINRFHELGFKVWMDDFGDGYASLNVLQDMNFDLIKLDIGFMRNFNPSGKNGVILRALLSMAKDLGIHTLAEGIETEAQFAFLKQYGCEKIQGFYFGKPTPTDELLKQVKQGTALKNESPETAASFEDTLKPMR